LSSNFSSRTKADVTQTDLIAGFRQMMMRIDDPAARTHQRRKCFGSRFQCPVADDGRQFRFAAGDRHIAREIGDGGKSSIDGVLGCDQTVCKFLSDCAAFDEHVNLPARRSTSGTVNLIIFIEFALGLKKPRERVEPGKQHAERESCANRNGSNPA